MALVLVKVYLILLFKMADAVAVEAIDHSRTHARFISRFSKPLFNKKIKWPQMASEVGFDLR